MGAAKYLIQQRLNLLKNKLLEINFDIDVEREKALRQHLINLDDKTFTPNDHTMAFADELVRLYNTRAMLELRLFFLEEGIKHNNKKDGIDYAQN